MNHKLNQFRDLSQQRRLADNRNQSYQQPARPVDFRCEFDVPKCNKKELLTHYNNPVYFPAPDELDQENRNPQDQFFSWFQQPHDFKKVQKEEIRPESMFGQKQSVQRQMIKPKLNVTVQEIDQPRESKKRPAKLVFSEKPALKLVQKKKLKLNLPDEEKTLARVKTVPNLNTVNFLEINKRKVQQQSDLAKLKKQQQSQSVKRPNTATGLLQGVFDKTVGLCLGNRKQKDKAQLSKELNSSFEKLHLTGDSTKERGRQFLYEPREAPSKAVREFELKTGQSWYQMSPDSRAQANLLLLREQKPKTILTRQKETGWRF